MPDDDPDRHIQPPPTRFSVAPPFHDGAGLGDFDQTSPIHKLRLAPPGMLFGGFVGWLMGGLTGLACCWLGDLHDFQWQGALVGALVGPLAGGLIGMVERKTRGELARPDIATLIGAIFGLVPGLLAFLQGLGPFRGGSFMGFVLVGTVFIGPMIGLLIGAMLDRAYEASRGKSWRTALQFGIAGLVAIAGFVVLLTWLMQGPNPEVLAKEVRSFLSEEWRKRPDLKDAKIKKVELNAVSRKEYAGFLDAMIAGQLERFSLKVIVETNTLDVQWTPIDK